MSIINTTDINAKVPNIPILGFNKSQEGYIFRSNFGNLRFKDESEIHIVNDIEIKIQDKICISFSIDWIGYSSYFCEKIDENTYGDLKELKYYEIDCISGEYHLYFTDCYCRKIEDSCKIYFQALQVNIIKNDDKINDCEQVNLWNVLEFTEISQSSVREFECNPLKNFFIKSRSTHDYSFIDENNGNYFINEDLKDDQFNSFNQLLDRNPILYTETEYQNVFSDEIENIEKLLMFYSAIISPIRMRIIEEKVSKKLEIIIVQKNNFQNFGKSIFLQISNNFFEYLDSAYENYFGLKNGDLNIDLLFYYYTWIKNEKSLEVQLVLCSAFMEILKNNQLDPSCNDEYDLFKRLQFRIDNAGLDSTKIFKYLQPAVYDVVYDIKNDFRGEEFYSDRKFNSTWKMFLKTYVSSIIKFYRNKLLHSGLLKMEKEDIELFVEKWKRNFRDSLRENQQKWADKIAESLKEKLIHYTRVYNAFDQCEFLKEFIELMLLTFLDVDCILTNEERFKTKVGVKKISGSNYEFDDISTNSRLYLEKFK